MSGSGRKRISSENLEKVLSGRISSVFLAGLELHEWTICRRNKKNLIWCIYYGGVRAYRVSTQGPCVGVSGIWGLNIAVLKSKHFDIDILVKLLSSHCLVCVVSLNIAIISSCFHCHQYGIWNMRAENEYCCQMLSPAKLTKSSQSEDYIPLQAQGQSMRGSEVWLVHLSSKKSTHVVKKHLPSRH
jgi:hypothetical protein